jgi:hypothetical protein
MGDRDLLHRRIGHLLAAPARTIGLREYSSDLMRGRQKVLERRDSKVRRPEENHAQTRRSRFLVPRSWFVFVVRVHVRGSSFGGSEIVLRGSFARTIAAPRGDPGIREP